jgi:hypothetical protein
MNEQLNFVEHRSLRLFQDMCLSAQLPRRPNFSDLWKVYRDFALDSFCFEKTAFIYFGGVSDWSGLPVLEIMILRGFLATWEGHKRYSDFTLAFDLEVGFNEEIQEVAIPSVNYPDTDCFLSAVECHSSFLAACDAGRKLKSYAMYTHPNPDLLNNISVKEEFWKRYLQ